MMTTVDLEVVGSAELVKMLGVSRPRAYQLTTRDDFPAPAASLTMGKIWYLSDVLDWAQARGRTLLPLDAPSISSDSTGSAKGSPSAGRD